MLVYKVTVVIGSSMLQRISHANGRDFQLNLRALALRINQSGDATHNQTSLGEVSNASQHASMKSAALLPREKRLAIYLLNHGDPKPAPARRRT